MYDLLSMSGKLKGDVGEIIYVNLNKYSHRTAFETYHWLDKLKIIIPLNLKIFLIKYWNTIDVFEFVIENNQVKNIIFYEIKTTKHRFKPRPLTYNSLCFYNKCQELGHIVKSIRIVLSGNWKFEVFEKEFNKKDFYIHSGNPKFSKNYRKNPLQK